MLLKKDCKMRISPVNFFQNKTFVNKKNTPSFKSSHDTFVRRLKNVSSEPRDDLSEKRIDSKQDYSKIVKQQYNNLFERTLESLKLDQDIDKVDESRLSNAIAVSMLAKKNVVFSSENIDYDLVIAKIAYRFLSMGLSFDKIFKVISTYKLQNKNSLINMQFVLYYLMKRGENVNPQVAFSEVETFCSDDDGNIYFELLEPMAALLKKAEIELPEEYSNFIQNLPLGAKNNEFDLDKYAFCIYAFEKLYDAFRKEFLIPEDEKIEPKYKLLAFVIVADFIVNNSKDGNCQFDLEEAQKRFDEELKYCKEQRECLNANIRLKTTHTVENGIKSGISLEEAINNAGSNGLFYDNVLFRLYALLYEKAHLYLN